MTKRRPPIAPPSPDGSERDLYYIEDTREEGAGSFRLWWGPERCGYTTRLDRAGVYTKAEAASIAKIRGTDVPRLKSDIDAISIRVVMR